MQQKPEREKRIKRKRYKSKEKKIENTNYFGIPRKLYQFLSYEERPNYEYKK